MKLKKICVLVSSPKARGASLQAPELFKSFPKEIEINFAYLEGSKLQSVYKFAKLVHKDRPDLIYCLNIGFAPSLVAIIARFLWNTPFVVETGDPLYILSKESGRNFFYCELARLMEILVPKLSVGLICASSELVSWYKKRNIKKICFLPNGVDTSKFILKKHDTLRKSLGLEGYLTIGIVASIMWSKQLKWCCGMDIIEILNLLKDLPVKGLIVGDGNGIPYLKETAKHCALEDRIIFTGWVKHSEVVEYINLIDICIITQIGKAGKYRTTTAKFPEYLACEKYIIASDIGGDTSRIVKEHGFLVNYSEKKTYCQDIANHIKEILKNPQILNKTKGEREIAIEEFEWCKLSKKLYNFIKSL